MEKVFSKTIPVTIFMEDGEKAEAGKKMAGVAVLGDDEMEFTFSKNAHRAKTCSHNPIQYAGNHTTARLLKNSDFRLTTMVPSNFDMSKETNIGLLVDEFKEALLAIKQ